MSRYEVWFRDDPFYMASVSRKTFKMLLKREPQNIARFRKHIDTAQNPR